MGAGRPAGGRRRRAPGVRRSGCGAPGRGGRRRSPAPPRPARSGGPARPPPATPQRRPRGRAGRAHLARALHLPLGAGLGRRRRRRARGLPRLPRPRRGGDDDGARLLRRLPRVHGCRVPRGRAPRHSGHPRHGAHGPRLLRGQGAPGAQPRGRARGVGRAVRALARRRRRTPRVCVHAALRPVLHARDAPRIRRRRPGARRLLADPPLGGPGRGGRGGPGLPRGARLRGRLRPGGRARAALGHGARDPPHRPRPGAPRGDGHAGGALPVVEPVPLLRPHAAGALPGRGTGDRSRLRCGRRAAPLALRRHAHGFHGAGRATRRGRRRPSALRSPRLAAARHAGRRPGAGARRRHGVAGGGQGGGSDPGGRRSHVVARRPGDQGRRRRPRGSDESPVFRDHPEMVRAAFVRGRRLPGPAGWEGPAGLDGPGLLETQAGQETRSIPGAMQGWSP